MNTAEKKALKAYNANKTTSSAEIGLMPMSDVFAMVKQQDRLYRVIHQRSDKRMFGAK